MGKRVLFCFLIAHLPSFCQDIMASLRSHDSLVKIDPAAQLGWKASSSSSPPPPQLMISVSILF